MENTNNTNDEASKALVATGVGFGAASICCLPLVIPAAIAIGIGTLIAAFEEGDSGDNDGSTAGWGG
jgi:hypothetical protein